MLKQYGYETKSSFIVTSALQHPVKKKHKSTPSWENCPTIWNINHSQHEAPIEDQQKIIEPGKVFLERPLLVSYLRFQIKPLVRYQFSPVRLDIGRIEENFRKVLS